MQGEWKRTSYPYGSFVFSNKQVKFIDGEGTAEPPEFQGYSLSKNCIPEKTSLSEDQYDFGLNTGNDVCQIIKINGTQLLLYLDGTSSNIAYEKVKP